MRQMCPENEYEKSSPKNCRQKLEWVEGVGKIGLVPRTSRLIVLLLVALWLTGCQTASQKPMAVTITTVTVPEAITVAPAQPIMEPPPIAPVIVTNAQLSKIAQNWPTNWINVWIPLATWGRYNSMEKFVQRGSNQAPVFDLHTSNAVMSLKVGTRLARFNGLECWLAYGPQLFKGLPYIHSLDAQKNLQPLVAPASYEFKTNRTIVLDPGHGGKDSGTKNIDSFNFEKEYTLDWALRLRRLLATNGWKVILTRTNDSDVQLGDRVALADRAKADLFLSLHFNSGLPNRDLAGVETYCLTPTGMPSNLVRTYEDDIKQSYPNNLFDEQNYQIAYRLHRELVQSMNVPDRGIRRARFMSVLRGQNRPAVLIEGGYLSNSAEAKKIASASHRQALAEAVARALE